MKIDAWRGHGHRKFHVLSAIALSGLAGSTANQIWLWTRQFDIGYSVISNTVNQALKTGLVTRRGARMRYSYCITDAGKQYLSDTRKRFD